MAQADFLLRRRFGATAVIIPVVFMFGALLMAMSYDAHGRTVDLV